MDALTTIGIGKTLGSVIESHDMSGMFREDFMRIRICINTTQPLCRGRKVNLSQGKIGWISFKFENGKYKTVSLPMMVFVVITIGKIRIRIGFN